MKRRMLVCGFFVVLTAIAACCTGQDTSANQGLDSDGLERLIRDRQEDFFLLDVRTPAEYESGHIPTAVNIPVDTIGSVFAAQNKNALIVVYCRSGNRSGTAKKILEQAGYANVVNFGAISDWTGPLVQGGEPGAY